MSSITNPWSCQSNARKTISESSVLQKLTYTYLPIFLLTAYILCNFQFKTLIITLIQNNNFFKIIPPALTVHDHKINNKVTHHIASALYTKYIRLTRFGCGFIMSWKFKILPWSKSSFPVDPIDAASLEGLR